MNNVNRNELKQLAQKIENLAKDFQVKLDNGGDFLASANELTRNNLTFVFTLGETYGAEQATKQVSGTVVNKGNGNRNYHNKRDSLGRFSSKV